MATGLDFPTFYDRFEHLRQRLRRYLGWQTLTVLAICTLLGIVTLAGLDYRFEMPWLVRAVGLGLTAGTGLLLAAGLLLKGLRRWTRFRTASAIERRFPELGQRVRTTVEHRGLSVAELKSLGVAPGLMRALETEAAVSTLPLPLENLIPTNQLLVLTGFAAVMFGFLGSAGMWSGDWQTAIRRALLADEPFTELSDATGQTAVDKGSELTLKAVLRGRMRDTVILRTRAVSQRDEPWDEQLLSIKQAEASSSGEWTYKSFLPNITEPFDYQWVAGPERSPQYHIDVRYPLQIESISVEVLPPAYTGLPPAMNADGNLNVLEGSVARFVIQLDGVPTSARITFNPVATVSDDAIEPETIEARIEGMKLHFEKTIAHDVNWKVEALSPHDIPMVENSYRIRVRKDQPPAVYFEEPSDSVDVHALAEVLMRIRVRDDFGLIRAGIVFQINNDEEHTLFAEEYQASSDQPASMDRLPPKTAAALERILPLEHFKLIQKDSITYYAFAEDNRPGQMQRTETELRFIDIRPFKIRYQLPSPTPPDDKGEPRDPRPRHATFEELIGRERSSLNRTLVMKRAKKPDLGGLDRLMKFEAETADLTNDLARFLQAQATLFQVPEVAENADLLFQAERAMLDSVDSMSVGKFEIAMLQEKDAVRFLIESRDRLTVFLENPKNPSGLRQAINGYFRQLQTKLRMKRQPSQDQQSKLEDLLSQLGQLANQQGMIAAQLNVMTVEGGASGNMPATEASEPNPGSSSNPDANGSGSNANANPDESSDGDGETATPASKMGSSGQMTRDEIAKRQLEIASESVAVQKELGQMPQATELAKRRMAAATEAAEAARGALERGSLKEATGSANTAAEKFEDVLGLAQALFARELAEQLDLARDMAEELSRREGNLANSDQSTMPADVPRTTGKVPAASGANEKQEAAAKSAERLAAAGESLVDVLNSATRSTAKADRKVIPKINDLLDKGGVSKAVERMQQQPAGIRSGRLGEEKKAAAEIADALDEAARKLDVMRREIVNPKVAELMKLESKAQELEQGLEDTQTRRQSEQWLQSAGDFLEQVKDASVDSDAAEDLKEEMKANGWDEKTNSAKVAGDREFEGNNYQNKLRSIAIEIREAVKQLLLSEMSVSGEETPPAQYEGMVTKYQRTLTLGGSVHEAKKKKARERRVK